MRLSLRLDSRRYRILCDLASWREIFCPPWRRGVLRTKPPDIIAQPEKAGPFEPVISQRGFPRFAH